MKTQQGLYQTLYDSVSLILPHYMLSEIDWQVSEHTLDAAFDLVDRKVIKDSLTQKNTKWQFHIMFT